MCIARCSVVARTWCVWVTGLSLDLYRTLTLTRAALTNNQDVHVIALRVCVHARARACVRACVRICDVASSNHRCVCWALNPKPGNPLGGMDADALGGVEGGDGGARVPDRAEGGRVSVYA